MSPPALRLDEAMRQIVDAAVAACDAARTEGDPLAVPPVPAGLLDGIEGVVSGDRTRSRPDAPYLWVTIGGARATHTRSLHETWTVSLMLNAFVDSEEPEDGWLEALQWAALASSVVLAYSTPELPARKLGLVFVSDTRRVSLEPIGQLKTGRRFGAFSRLDVETTISEPQEA